MKVRVGQIGARMYYGIPHALESMGILEKIYTDFTSNKGLPKLLSRFRKFAKLKNRLIPSIPPSRIVHLPDYGLFDFMRLRYATDESEVNELHFKQGCKLERQMMADGLKGIDAVSVIGSPSELLFTAARKKGIMTVAEQIIAPGATYLAIMKTFLKEYQDWEDVRTTESTITYWQNVSEREWAQTDYLLCGSDFVRNSVIACGVDAAKLIMIPYGVPSLLRSTSALKQFSGDRKLRVLFVGSVCIRKGIQYLLEIAEAVSSFCEIKICGAIALKSGIISQYENDVSFEGHVSRADLGAYYEWADVFVLPTLFEGSATVCYEAIQYALPIITTYNSGIFLKDNEGITIIPEGNKRRLQEALTDYFENPEKIALHSAILESKADFASSEAYRGRLTAFFTTLSRTRAQSSI